MPDTILAPFKAERNTKKRRHYYCVKCGGSGTGSQFLPATPNARKRWQKFTDLITCPVCGDDKGHAGLLEGKADFAHQVDFEPSPISPLSLSQANALASEIINAMSPESAVTALCSLRNYDADLSAWLATRGVRFGSVADVRFSGKISEATFEWLKEKLGKKVISILEKVFWLPVVNYPQPNNPAIVAFQLRRLEGEPRYLTVRIAERAPLVHVALPTDDRTNGQRWSGVLLTEGILKAEIVAYKLGVVAVGALGTGALHQAAWVAAEAARRWHKDANLFNAPIILAPDSDARSNLSVAKAFWEVAKKGQQEGFAISFAVWSPKFKGIDDALLAGEMPTVVAPETWLATLKARIRHQLLKVKVRPRLLLDAETAETLDLPESVSLMPEVVTQVYEAAKRKETWLQALSTQSQNGKAAIVVDSSPAGSGKTYAATQMKVSELRKAGLFVKRLVYISPEVKRTAVKPLERFRLFVGRDEFCSFWDRLQQVEAEGLTKVGKRICAHCPVRKQCQYYAQRQSSGRRYWRISWQSYNPREGDFLVLDEFSRLPLWRDFTVTLEQLNRFIELLDRYGTSQPIMEAFKAIKEAVQQGKDLRHSEIAHLCSVIAAHQWDDFAHNLQTLFSDIRKVRSWVFKQDNERPTWLGWAQAIADILRGHLVGQVWVEAGTLKVKVLDSKLRDAVKKVSAILVLDATVDPVEVERLLDASVTVVKSDEPEKFPTVLQVPLGALSHRARPETQRRWLWLAKQVVEALQRKGYLPANARIGVLTHKNAAEIAQRIFGKNAIVGWWGRDDRATNAFYENSVKVLVCVGLPHRNIGAVAAEQLKAGERQRALRKVRLDPQGHWWTVLGEFAELELAIAVRREAAVAYLQAAGRLRQGRRSEPCYLVVLDTEPLPEALNPLVIPPEAVLPTELWQEWQRRRQRGAAVINALRQKAAAERLAKAAKAVAFYQEIVGTDPKPAWLAQVLGVHRNWARKLLAEVSQTAHYICEKDKETEGTAPIAQMKCAVCDTLENAIRTFLAAGYPIPVRALARRFNTNDNKVRRLVRRLALEPTSTHRSGKQTLYHLPNQRLFEPTNNGHDGHHIEFDQCDQCSGKPKQNKAFHNGHATDQDDQCNDRTMVTMVKDDMTNMTNVTNVSQDNGQTDDQDDHYHDHYGNANKIRRFGEQWSQWSNPISATDDQLDPLPEIVDLEAFVSESLAETDSGFVDTEELLASFSEPDQPDRPDPSENEPTENRPVPTNLPDDIACLCGGRLRLVGRSYRCSRCSNPLPVPCRHCGAALKIIDDGQAVCLECGLQHSFDRLRQRWLCDLDPV